MIVQDREDSNAQSVLKSFQAATPHAKTKAVPAVPPATPPKAPPPKLSTTSSTPSTDVAKAAAPTTKPKPKPKPKPKAKALTDAEKAKTPCIVSQMPSGCIHGDNCKFSHKIPAAKGKPKAKETAKARPGAVAKAVVALVAASSLCVPATSFGPTHAAEGADTAAGRHLGSAKASLDQRIPRQAFDHLLGASRSPVTFHTGGGPQPGVQALGFESDNMDFANHYMLDSCP